MTRSLASPLSATGAWQRSANMLRAAWRAHPYAGPPLAVAAAVLAALYVMMAAVWSAAVLIGLGPVAWLWRGLRRGSRRRRLEADRHADLMAAARGDRRP